MADNGVVRMTRKGRKKFAFGDDEPFEIDVVEVFEAWLAIDDQLRPPEDEKGERTIPRSDIHNYHNELVRFVETLRETGLPKPEDYVKVSKAEAQDFLARLREEYDELVHFFRPKSLAKPESPDTSAPVSTVFSEET